MQTGFGRDDSDGAVKMNDPLEIELKLEFDPDARARLERLTPFKGTTAARDQLVSTYFDTAARDLHAAGYTLRVRRQGDRRIQTIKAEGEAGAGLFVRPEWEREIEGDVPVIDAASGPIEQLAEARPLAPQFVSDVARRSRQLSFNGAEIEVAIDVGEVRAGTAVQPLAEVELELKGGSAEALFALARRINQKVPLRLGVRSKSERGHALVSGADGRSVKAEPVQLDPTADPRAAFATVAGACLRQFRLNEALLMESGGAAPLHQCRVGLRRLRSAFSLFKPLLADDTRAGVLRAELRWLASELGEVRNLDVLVERVDAGARDRIVQARARAFTHARGELTALRTRLLMIDLSEWLAIGDWRRRATVPIGIEPTIQSFAATLLDRHRKRLKRRGKGLADLVDEQRHEVRIEAKKLRYATEFFATLWTGKRARRRHATLSDAIVGLQEHLGELNDHATGVEVLANLGIDATLPSLGKNERRRHLAKAEDAYDRLMDTKCFWR